MALRSRACSAPRRGIVAPEQGDVAGGDPVGDAAEAFLVGGAEDGAAGDGVTHAGGERARREQRFAEAGAGEGGRGLGEISGHGDSFAAR